MSSRFHANVIISSLCEEIGATSLSTQEVKDVHVVRDTRNGKDEILVKINGKTIFKYDAIVAGRNTLIQN